MLRGLFWLLLVLMGIGALVGDDAVQSSADVPKLLAADDLPRIGQIPNQKQLEKKYGDLIEFDFHRPGADMFGIRSGFYRDYRDSAGKRNYETLIEDTPIILFGRKSGAINRFQVHIHSEKYGPGFGIEKAFALLDKLLPQPVAKMYSSAPRYRLNDELELYCLRGAGTTVEIIHKLRYDYWTITADRYTRVCDYPWLKQKQLGSIRIK